MSSALLKKIEDLTKRCLVCGKRIDIQPRGQHVPIVWRLRCKKHERELDEFLPSDPNEFLKIFDGQR